MEIKFLGNYRNQNQGFCGSVYSRGGCCPGLRARDYKEPVLILEVVDGQRKSNRNDKEIRQQK